MPAIPQPGKPIGTKAPGGPDINFDWNPVSWWEKWFNAVSGWLGGIGGQIASGIEAANIAILKDIWAVVLPFVEILAGALLALFVINVFILSSHTGQAAIGAIAMGVK